MPKSTSHAANSPVIDLRGSFGEFVRQAVQAIPRVYHLLLVWQQRVSDRTRLSQMPHYMLRDMGLTPSDVNHELSKPFWKA